MKKVLLVLVALVLVLSGVAMVSAYEAHIINVKAHVENAMSVSVSRFYFGTVFPEEFFVKNFNVGTSGSFCSATQGGRASMVNTIDYQIWAEWKVKTDPDGVPNSGDETYYEWLGEALWLAKAPVPDLEPDGVTDLADDTFPTRTIWTNIGSAPSGPPGVKQVLTGLQLHKPAVGTPDIDPWKLALDVPVFEGYYNELTDPDPKPSGVNDPSLVILESDTARHHPDGIQLGVDLKIQVTDLYWLPY